MKIMTVLGTRPEIIRLSRVIAKLDALCQHIVVHTGQNYDPNLNDIFFQQMQVRPPNYYLGARGTIGEQIGMILTGVEQLLLKEKPDKFLVLGDTNSAISVFVAKRMGIPVYHMEAGNRCYDDRVPEEVNRRVIDHSSDVLMPYTERSRQNLLREGIRGQRVFVTGNPILEVLQSHEDEICASSIFTQLELQPKEYFLVTMHRAENVDVEERLRSLTHSLNLLQQKYQVPIIVSTHPHTRARMEQHQVKVGNGSVRYLPPFGLFDFVALERNARLVLSDSGTVQEECCIFHVPNVTLRDVTERPETIECGSNVLSGANLESILTCVDMVLSRTPSWTPPVEYLAENVSSTVANIVLGYLHS
ncbi:MAG TPA: UDP-N-acetylglucosamine 2-epimerase (non-hydrolyzing) [Anaerolineaceae bacterium]|nr:UDP-N-acetylglucosamine 2-epimerase (non-hydrolyzing) [Anaerolineaceae bacterium]